MRKMKDSGIAWIGEIPAEWQVVKVKHNFTSHKEIVGNFAGDYERLALTLNGVIKRSKDDSTGLQPEVFTGYQILRKNELVFKLIDLANVQTSRIGYSPYLGIVSPAYIILHPNQENESKYGEYFFLSMWQREIFNHIGDDGVRSSLNVSDLRNIPYLAIPIQEKKEIAAFLDEKCAHIDAVIEKTRASIDEYKKLKQAIITRAVTKGLREGRKMKDSGCAFVHGIPETWQNQKLLSILSMRIIDGFHESPELIDEGVPYVSATAIENGIINFDKIRGYISKRYSDLCDKRYRPQMNDILMIKLGATTGAVARIKTEQRFNIWVPLAAIRCNSVTNPDFVFFALQADYAQRQIQLSWTYGTQQTLGVKTIEGLRIILPPLPEQQEIASFLDAKTAAIDRLIAKKEQLVAEMESCKKSLIYEVVTGKREVPA